MDWLYPLSGFVVGAIVGLTGMGGGSLMTPLLILLFGVHPLTAVGTDLLYAAVTKTAGTAIHSKKGNVDWHVAGLLAAGSVPATVLTIWVLSRVPKQSPTAATIISVAMGVVLIIAAVAIFFRRLSADAVLYRSLHLLQCSHANQTHRLMRDAKLLGSPLSVIGILASRLASMMWRSRSLSRPEACARAPPQLLLDDHFHL